MQTATDNLMQIAAELNAAGKQVKVTVLKPYEMCQGLVVLARTLSCRRPV